jgi:hypothetical protein
MSTPQSPIQGVAYTYYFLNLAGGYWWEYIDQATHQKVRLECTQLSPANPHTFQLKSHPDNILPEMVLEVKDVPGSDHPQQQCIWLQATMLGKTLTWDGGLRFPVAWAVGEKVTATSKVDLRGNAEVTLKKFDNFQPPSGSIFLPGGFPISQIDLEITVKTDVFGTVFHSPALTFVGALGLFSGNFTTLGGTHLLILQQWSGRH